MSRIATTLLFVWTLLLGPALCMGGLLEHECACAGSAEESHGDPDHCDHEDNCASDPCETLARPDGLGAEQHLGSEILAVPLSRPGDNARQHALRGLERWSPRVPPDRPLWPYVERNRPLLI